MPSLEPAIALAAEEQRENPLATESHTRLKFSASSQILTQSFTGRSGSSSAGQAAAPVLADERPVGSGIPPHPGLWGWHESPQHLDEPPCASPLPQITPASTSRPSCANT